MSFKVKVCTAMLFSLLSRLPVAVFFALYGSFGDMYRALASLFVINPVTLTAGFLGYKQAEKIANEKNWKVLFKIGSLLALKSAVIGGFLFMVLAIFWQFMLNGFVFNPLEIVGSYIIFLFGCVFLFWLIFPIAGLGCIAVNKIINTFFLVE